jgi:uncharacterized protein
MRLMLRQFLAAIALIFAFSAISYAEDPARIQVVFYTMHGEVAQNMELATTPEARALGLMNRSNLSSDGMLFVFPRAQEASFWMKDTRIALDMIFIDKNYTVIRIERNARPQTLTPRNSGKPVIAVAELMAGQAENLNISDGDKVRFVLPEGQEIK